MCVVSDVKASSAWQRLAQAPHRAYFAVGVLSFLLLALWWSAALPLPGLTAQPSMLVHGLMMPLGIFPPFMLGFVFTAGPRWLNAPAPGGHLPLAAGQFLGLLLTLAGFAAGTHWPLPGLFLLFIVWWSATGKWMRCINAAPPQVEKLHALAILGAMLIGNAGLLCVIGWVLSNDASFWLLAKSLILWGWILPVFLVVSHRMIPFFTQAVLPQREAWRPMGLLYVWLAGCVLQIAAATAALPWLGLLAALVLCCATLYAAWRWAGRPLLRWQGVCGGNRLLAMLHLSFAWLPLAFLLQILGMVGISVGSAAVHALGLGFCSTMLVGFVTRVSLGHSGQPLQADNTVWFLYLALHAVALLRVILALSGGASVWLHATAALWLLVIAAWGMRLLPVFWRPRVDGKAG